MSAIGTRLDRNVNGDIELSAYVFGPVMIAWVAGDITGVQARNFTNNHLQNNGYAVLTGSEETDTQTMNTHYGTLTDFDKHVYRDKLVNYTQLMQQGEINVAQWDALMGL